MGSEILTMTVAQCVADIEVADFVALDLEFSGLFLSVERERRTLSIDDYFGKCLESIPKFLPLQLGVCCARRRDDTGTWEMRTHEFNLWPQDRRIFAADMQSLRFLRQHGFDFNSYFEKAHTYGRLPPMESSAQRAKPAANHASLILGALRETHRPMVLHNGLLDLLHLYDKFVGKLPEGREAFCASWVKQFPLLFDTRNIAQEGRYQVLKHVGGLSLEELHRHFQSLKELSLKFTHIGRHADGPAHGSSGKDASLTAEVFVYEMELWIRHSNQANRKRRRLDSSDTGLASGHDDGWNTVRRKTSTHGAVDIDPSTEGLWSATLLQTHKICKRFHNVVAIVGASPGQLHLGKPSGPVLPAPSPPVSRVPGASPTQTQVQLPAAVAKPLVAAKQPASKSMPVPAPEPDVKASASVLESAKTTASAPESADDAASGECAADDPYTSA